MATIDHLILRVNALEASVAFYTELLGFADEGQQGPFRVLRVNDDFVLQLAPYGTEGHEHYAFMLSHTEFEAAFARIQAQGLPWGPSFNTVGRQGVPGVELGARGPAACVYLLDPNKHLIEIRCEASLAAVT